MGNRSATRSSTRRATRTGCRVEVWQLARSTPRELPWQHVVEHELRIEPATDERREERDGVGNGVTDFAVYCRIRAAAVRSPCRSRSRAADPFAPSRSAGSGARRRVGASRRRPISAGALSEPSAPFVVGSGARLRGTVVRTRPSWLEAIVRPVPRIHADSSRAGDDCREVDEGAPSSERRRRPRRLHARLPARARACRRATPGLPCAPSRARAAGLLDVDGRTPGRAWSPAMAGSARPTRRAAPTSATSPRLGANSPTSVPLRGVILGGRAEHGRRGRASIPSGEEKPPPLKGAPRGGAKRPSAGWCGEGRPGRLAAFATGAVPATCPRPIAVAAADREHAGEPVGAVGPGWFDSSWELRSGLQVREGLPSDLPLHGWIEAWLQLVGGGSGLSLSAT